MKRSLGTGVKVVAAAADRVRPAPAGTVVLIYHRVGGGSGSQLDLPIDLFDAQVGELVASGRLVSLDEALAAPRAGSVVLTFDDGTADWVDHALPVLARHGAPATFYVATDFVEAGRPFPSGPAISWAGLAELVASGLATIGSHTHTHALLDRADAATAAQECDRSVELIGERLGVACDHFAYPKALAGSPAAEAEVRRRFRSAALAGSRANPVAGLDPHRLARTPVQVGDGMRWFRRKADGGLRLEDAARGVLNRWRYAGATT